MLRRVKFSVDGCVVDFVSVKKWKGKVFQLSACEEARSRWPEKRFVSYERNYFITRRDLTRKLVEMFSKRE